MQTTVATTLIESREEWTKATDYVGWTCLYSATINGDIDLINVLIEKKANPRAQTERRGQPMHWVAEGRNVDAIILLQEIGAEISALDNDSSTPMHEVATYGWIEVIKAMADMGSSRNQ